MKQVMDKKVRISIHTPAKGVTCSAGTRRGQEQISIHTPAKGVTEGNTSRKLLAEISIHTPAKGVTEQGVDGKSNKYISIHTPAKGVTDCVCSIHLPGNYFNPHSREGSDSTQQFLLFLLRNFNPHSREGSDVFSELLCSTMYLFQSTLPRRE